MCLHVPQNCIGLKQDPPDPRLLRQILCVCGTTTGLCGSWTGNHRCCSLMSCSPVMLRRHCFSPVLPDLWLLWSPHPISVKIFVPRWKGQRAGITLVGEHSADTYLCIQQVMSINLVKCLVWKCGFYFEGNFSLQLYSVDFGQITSVLRSLRWNPCMYIKVWGGGKKPSAL